MQEIQNAIEGLKMSLAITTDADITYTDTFSRKTIKQSLKALEKQRLKRFIQHTGLDDSIYYSCPNCQRIYWEKQFIDTYCGTCGQKIREADTNEF